MMDANTKSSGSSDFFLDKWFLDVVTEDHRAMIIYSAKLKWKGFSVPYTSILYANPEGKVSLKSRLSNVTIPENNDGLINWSDQGFNISGTWRTQTTTFETDVYSSNQGDLKWYCLQPRSECTIKTAFGDFKGFGYVERLALNIEPWRIPMQSLRWGRYCSAKNSIVWIQIRGQYSKQWLWENGKPVNNVTITDTNIVLPDQNIKLKLDHQTVLESEKKILSTVRKLIKNLPGFRSTIPMKFLGADEIKWLSRGRISTNEKLTDTGWCIHEFVNFDP